MLKQTCDLFFSFLPCKTLDFERCVYSRVHWQYVSIDITQTTSTCNLMKSNVNVWRKNYITWHLSRQRLTKYAQDAKPHHTCPSIRKRLRGIRMSKLIGGGADCGKTYFCPLSQITHGAVAPFKIRLCQEDIVMPKIGLREHFYRY